MSLQADMLADRRRLKRRLVTWRIVGVLAVAAAIAAYVFADGKVLAGLKPHVARVSISGIISDDRDQQDMFDKLAESENVRAVVLRVNSPGGTTTGGEALYENIRRLAEKKPVVAVFGTIATSAAYLISLGADHIVARGNSITGSVGVILQWAEVTELMKTLGIKMEEVKSGPLKAVPSPFEPATEEARAVTREMVLDGQKWFLSLVAERRKLAPESVPGLVEGRVYSGRQAIELKLVDEIGGERNARAWLERERGIPAKMDIIDWKPKDRDDGILSMAARSLARLAGLGGGLTIGETGLGGLTSVWTPSSE